MAKRGKGRRGYEPDSRRDHPGVTISEEKRDGEKVVMLRWREPLPGGRKGKRKAEFLFNDRGQRVKSRTAAHPYAVAKSNELAKEAAELAKLDQDHHDETNPNATWEELKQEHDALLERKGRSAKSAVAYRYSWSFVESWRNRPALPKQLTVKALESFTAHLRKRKLSEGSQTSILAHVRVILNFGRARLHCVRLQPEAINGALEAPKGALEPTVLDTTHLRSILKAASAWDADHPDSQTFPLLAFLMLTGGRRGEAERLRWRLSKSKARESWIDFEGDRLLIFGQKIKRQRTVPLSNRPLLKALLETMRDDVVDLNEKPFVFGGRFPLAIGDKRHEETVIEVDGEPVKVRGRSLKRALTVVRGNSGGDWAIKDLRSTYATCMANTLYGSQLYRLAEENGHRQDVLVEKYAKHYSLPDKQKSATTVEGVLGIDKLVKGWIADRHGEGGKVIRLRSA